MRSVNVLWTQTAVIDDDFSRMHGLQTPHVNTHKLTHAQQCRPLR